MFQWKFSHVHVISSIMSTDRVSTGLNFGQRNHPNTHVCVIQGNSYTNLYISDDKTFPFNLLLLIFTTQYLKNSILRYFFIISTLLTQSDTIHWCLVKALALLNISITGYLHYSFNWKYYGLDDK